MPHIKVKPFEKSSIDEVVSRSQILTFCATSQRGEELLLGIEYASEEFLLQLKPIDEGYLLKYDKVTRPANVALLKEALQRTAEELNLEILSSNIAPEKKHSHSGSSPYFKSITDFEEMIFPKKRLAVEVGFGSGRHLLYQATKNPDILYIGLEIHTPSIQQVLKQIALQGLTNIWVVNYDARLFLELLPSNSCQHIFVHFPVPWDKKPHRRVISPQFLEESLRVLSQTGKLELRTDSDNYFWYALEVFFAKKKIEVQVRKNEALEVTSKYEARWLKQNKDIYDVYVASQGVSEEKKIEGDFNFNIVKYKDGLEEKITTETIVKEGCFIHFERVYILQRAMLLKCAFGSFDRPEHKYILVTQEGVRYFVSTPVKTGVNLHAHQALETYLKHCLEEL
jgi:tRNA (guanine-N7-)-methyltransferase